MTDVNLKAGDTAPKRRFALLSNGVAQNITGATITMILSNGDSEALAVVAPGTDGIVEWDPAGSGIDVSVPMSAAIEFHVVYADGTRQVFPDSTNRDQLVVHRKYTAL